MTLPSSHRKYGSVEGRRAYSAGRASFDFDPSLELRKQAGDEEHEEGGRRWFTLVVVGVLAVGVMMGLTRAGYRLPKLTRESEGESNLMEVTSAVTPYTAEKTAPAVLPRPFPKGPAISSTLLTSEEIPPLSFTALNFYQERDGKPALDYPWLKDFKLIEPHRDTTFSVVSPRDGYEYRWAVRGGGDLHNAEVLAEATGSEVVMVLTVLDDNVVTLEEVDRATGTVARRLEERTMVKYVRREIRTLTDDDRDELFDAVRAQRVDGRLREM